ncbi:MAG: hypothetical protein Kow0074_09610 [Candidatus Zixiibacteriota bacterium]
MRWVLRHGTADVPSEWRDHIDGCARCRDFIADITALDTMLAESDVPDPGKEYWEGFAPSVARRLETLQESADRAPATVRGRWAWVRLWAPAVGVAVLALLIGRELSRDYSTKPAIMDRDIPVQTRQAPAAVDEPEPAVERKSEEQSVTEPVARAEMPRADVADAIQQPPVPQSPAVHEGPTMTAQPEETPSDPSESQAEMPGNVADELDMGRIQADIQIPEMADPRSPTLVEPDDDVSVWPDRRVQTLGQLGQDAREQPTLDDMRLREQNSPGLADRRTWTSPGAETSGTPSPLARLEGRRAFRSATLPDSQSPTEAMRRFDELTGLREQIAVLEAISPHERTQEQTRELCAMWYRTGQITLDPAELDRAIQRMEIYIVDLDDSLRTEWIEKKTQLVSRRASLDR